MNSFNALLGKLQNHNNNIEFEEREKETKTNTKEGDEEETNRGKKEDTANDLTPYLDDDELIENKRQEIFKDQDKKQAEKLKELEQLKAKLKKQKELTWRGKVLRFLTYCIAGLSDYTITFEQFITFNSKCQSGSSDLNDFIQESMCIQDLDSFNPQLEEIKFLKCQNITSLNEKSTIRFNEESLASCIRQGYIIEQIDNIKYFPEFLKLLLSKYCSNKILSKEIFNPRCLAWIFEIFLRTRR